MDSLREKVAIVPRNAFKGMRQTDEGAEAKVYANEKRGVAYKVVQVFNGKAGFGFIPGPLRVDAKGDVRVDVGDGLSAIEFLRRIDRGNQQGGTVYTEWVGITEDGDLVFKQPFIKKTGKRPKDFKESLLNRGLVVVADGKETAAIGKVGDQWVLFDDLHDQNILMRKGEPYVIDALNRPLTADDWKVLAKKGITPEKAEAMVKGKNLSMSMTGSDVTQSNTVSATPNIAAIQQAADAFIKPFGSKVPVRVVENSSQLDGDTAEAVRAKEQSGKAVEAYYDPKKREIVVFAKHATSEKRLQQLILHELVGHHGLQSLFQGELAHRYGKITLGLYETLNKLDFGPEWAGRHGYSKLEQLALDYEIDTSTLAGKQKLIEEHLARVAETHVKPVWYRRAIAQIRDLLRQLFPGMRWTEGDVSHLLQKAREAVRKSEHIQESAEINFSIRTNPEASEPVSAPDGSIDWGEIDKANAKKYKIDAGPIRLLEGEQFTYHKGFGKKHIEVEHGKDLERLSFQLDKFVHRIVQGFEEIGVTDNGRILLIKSGKPRSFAVLEWRYEKGGYYSIVTAFPEGAPSSYYIKKLKMVRSGRRAATQPKASQSTYTAQGQATEAAPSPPRETLVDRTTDPK